MTTLGIDHVNIIVRDLAISARYYADVLGLDPNDPPAPHRPDELQWLHDATGRPVIHLRARPGSYSVGTGAIDHIAFTCRDYPAAIARLERHSLPYTTDEVASIGLRQIRVIDPDGVELELNFSDA
ncbi:VOC family protein [Polymorphobacter sp. PAMC 29334]|uniref:VOC family protein n=1 Tax=Polymorphobacter sp. PAMC 29334 TaxID=2862331 RepID=UPI001C753EB3|nr:VOC family protein [Polymorphobacter sp. PAMC 29334]QYE35594.1 VOC family protein [Polymorphobacter sp. PAMC 29334]